MMALLGDGEKQKWGLEERGRLLGTIPRNCTLPWPLLRTFFFLLLSPLPDKEIPPSWALTAMMFHFIMGPETEPVTMD